MPLENGCEDHGQVFRVGIDLAGQPRIVQRSLGEIVSSSTFLLADVAATIHAWRRRVRLPVKVASVNQAVSVCLSRVENVQPALVHETRQGRWGVYNQA